MRIRLEPLGPQHGPEILAGQDEALALEIIGRPWTAASLEVFLARCAHWRADGPLRELAALETGSGRLLGGGGLNRHAPGLARDQVALTYWLLADARGRGLGVELAAGMLGRAGSMPGVREAVLLIDPANAASQACARRIGARLTGEWAPHPAGRGRTAERWVAALGE
ncbi:GNAT family N-acetyltransferase [Brachybacterium sp. J144]|uniref:GNAT family N-acetyltransferase n=1 Tax=Brachybacterium sp. J144 TaxID=3116487 RepID=UPI002E77D7C8|nr:GNAT family N-acetyltransferase [Brachybacterium sp. J144]MEE1651507.1 GNAT family N-acetyltransferase [Brachybacterium sp. J144]